MVLTTINSEGHFGVASSHDINEQWRLIEHIDVVVKTGDSKKKHARSNDHEKQQLQGWL
jgi:hypothetical protein